MVFMTSEELFEHIVIFFRLINSLATFQMIMNEILWDLINTGEVASFIDNVIVKTEEEEGYDEVIEKCKHLKVKVHRVGLGMQWAQWCKLVRTTLVSTYMLCLLWAVWLQFQRMVL